MRPEDLDLENPKNRTYARLVLARRDITEAYRIVRYVINRIARPNDPLFDPLSCAAVIAYSRPFISTRGYPGLPKRYKSFDSAQLSALHGEIIRLRNTCVAHSDEDVNKVFLRPAKEGGSSGGGSKAARTYGGIRSRGILLSAFPVFKDLCEHQLAELKAHIGEQEKLLFT